MKITKTQLKQIIKEELESVINEDGHTDVPSAIRKLKTATEDAMQILHALEGHHDQRTTFLVDEQANFGCRLSQQG